jgi:hypothetical protein
VPEALPVVAVPTTQKGQLDELFKTLGASDYAGAMAAIGAFNGNVQNFANEQKAFFDLLGVKDQAAALTAFAQIKSDRDALFNALGNSPDIESAIGVITNMQNERNALWKACGATDHNSAVAAITTLHGRVTTAEAAQKDFEGRLEAGIQQGVITRAASAGIVTPVPKATTPVGTVETMTPRRRLGALINEQIGQPALSA